MNLSTDLAELDGTGVPLCNLFTSIDNPDGVCQSVVSGTSICISKMFLEPLRGAGFFLLFFNCDKNPAETKAI